MRTSNDTVQVKKAWIKPMLTVHGPIEKITRADKDFGDGDGIILQPDNQPIDYYS